MAQKTDITVLGPCHVRYILKRDSVIDDKVSFLKAFGFPGSI